MKLSELVRETRKVSVVLGSSALSVEYRVNALTPQMESLLSNQERPLEVLVDVIVTLVAGWELENDNGEPYPIEHEAVMKLPVSFLMAVLQVIVEDMRPNPMSAGG